MSSYVIREIKPEDNEQVKTLVQSVLVEMGVPKVGTAYEDASLNDMHAEYNAPNKEYFVVEDSGKVVGCAGIAPLANFEGSICELQKMYFLPEVRGKGVGAEMMKRCLEFAKAQGFEKCYIETMPYMKQAQKLYLRSGFESLEGPLGDTGHYNCSVWLIRDL
ncbi:GNAT family N-acetyltransferase [Salinimicrobium terrae]|uniref:GNAT family N-acetyltransferase n=1 Tax=Salinimicrobium terrae TaxID=470866 RepID=UPI000407F5C7|nr:GNAT family N-acetyltransferase [Salinimicrobium terrae]